MKPTISVIIPVFNAKDFIERCILSLKHQTYDTWEAICIDDGSTDGCADILDVMASEDCRIKVAHKHNEGVSQARNLGIKKASGTYITFVDADDFLHPQAFEICINMAIREHPDMITYTYHRAYRRNVFIKNLLKLPIPIFPKFKHYILQDLEYKITDNIYKYATEYSHTKIDANERKWIVKHCQPWRCLYKKDIVKNIMFPTGIIYEDFPWWGDVLLNVKKTVILNLPLYFYYPNRLSYIFNANRQFKITSLEKAIEISESIYNDKALPYQKEMWYKNFIVPFKKKLASKIRKEKH